MRTVASSMLNAVSALEKKGAHKRHALIRHNKNNVVVIKVRKLTFLKVLKQRY